MNIPFMSGASGGQRGDISSRVIDLPVDAQMGSASAFISIVHPVDYYQEMKLNIRDLGYDLLAVKAFVAKKSLIYAATALGNIEATLPSFQEYSRKNPDQTILLCANSSAVKGLLIFENGVMRTFDGDPLPRPEGCKYLRDLGEFTQCIRISNQLESIRSKIDTPVSIKGVAPEFLEICELIRNPETSELVTKLVANEKLGATFNLLQLNYGLYIASSALNENDRKDTGLRAPADYEQVFLQNYSRAITRLMSAVDKRVFRSELADLRPA